MTEGAGWRLLPPLAIGLLVLLVAATIAVAGTTLGYDFLAYHAAAERVLSGQPAYDTSFQAAGGFGLFYYPPTFIPLVLPFGLLPATTAVAAWIGLLLVAFLVGVALLPVRTSVRWLVLLLAAQSWPFLYAIKLGQVGPLLFLLFAIGWRWLDTRPAVLGVSAGLGAAIKLQPGLILVWALLTRRWVAAAAGVGVLAVLAVAATLLSGFSAWTDFLLLVGRVSDPITTPNNVTPGAVAYGLGASRELASIVQYASMGLAVVAVVFAALRLASAPSYLVAVVASQLLSPILWDHYALLLMLPVAWMLERGRWWAIGIPIATSVVLVGVIPAWVYPLAFWASLVGVIGIGLTRGRGVLVAESVPADPVEWPA
jgi:alpha-1,2-mannosyltransferase